jgi:hypothetical protein
MISGYLVKEALNVRWCETSTVVLVSGTTNNGAVVDESKLIGLIVTFCKIKISNCNYEIDCRTEIDCHFSCCSDFVPDLPVSYIWNVRYVHMILPGYRYPILSTIRRRIHHGIDVNWSVALHSFAPHWIV